MNSSRVTLLFRDFIDKVRTGELFCPRSDHGFVLLSCVNPPSKKELLRLFEAAVKRNLQYKDAFTVKHRVGLLALIELMNSKPSKEPEKHWVLLLLSKIPGKVCPIF